MKKPQKRVGGARGTKGKTSQKGAVKSARKMLPKKTKLAKNDKVSSAKTTKKGSAPAKAAAGPNESLFPYGSLKHGDLAWHIATFEKLVKKFEEAEQILLRNAFVFAKERHEKQLRKDGSPYIIHPLRIANMIGLEWGIRQAPLIAAALLHDVIEDTQTTIREVKDGFGDEIGKLVDGLTMWPGSETPEVYLKRVSRGPRELRIIKCADVLDNLRSWHECGDGNADRFTRWWRQAHDFALPMAEETLDAAAKRIREIVEDAWYLKKASMM